MNVLVLIRELDKTPLEREVRNGYAHGEVITFYNESDEEYNLVIDTIEYNKLVQACIVLKENGYYLYIQHDKNLNFIKLNIDSIEKINYFIS